MMTKEVFTTELLRAVRHRLGAENESAAPPANGSETPRGGCCAATGQGRFRWCSLTAPTTPISRGSCNTPIPAYWQF